MNKFKPFISFLAVCLIFSNNTYAKSKDTDFFLGDKGVFEVTEERITKGRKGNLTYKITWENDSKDKEQVIIKYKDFDINKINDKLLPAEVKQKLLPILTLTPSFYVKKTTNEFIKADDNSILQVLEALAKLSSPDNNPQRGLNEIKNNTKVRSMIEKKAAEPWEIVAFFNTIIKEHEDLLPLVNAEDKAYIESQENNFYVEVAREDDKYYKMFFKFELDVERLTILLREAMPTLKVKDFEKNYNAYTSGEIIANAKGIPTLINYEIKGTSKSDNSIVYHESHKINLKKV